MDPEDYGHLKLNLHTSAASSGERRRDGADFLAEQGRMAFMIQRDRFSSTDANAARVLGESGSGRTRIEANTPAGTQVVGTP